MYLKSAINCLIITIIFSIQGCAVYYKDLNDHSYSESNRSSISKLSYSIKDLPIVATDTGMQAIEDTFKSSRVFQDMEKFYDDTIPKKGVYINVEPLYKAPSIAAMGFGYLSVSTLTLLPSWSNHDGYKVRFTVYRDGKLVKTLMYDRERFVAIWIGLLPFAWTNLFTSDEYDAFKSITEEFLNDLPRLLKR